MSQKEGHPVERRLQLGRTVPGHMDCYSARSESEITYVSVDGQFGIIVPESGRENGEERRLSSSGGAHDSQKLPTLDTAVEAVEECFVGW